jgi:hypothetical protein
MATTAAKKGAEAEINRLRAQVRELQAQMARAEADVDDQGDDRDDEDGDGGISDLGLGRAAGKATDTAADLSVRVMDEVGKLARGLTFAYLEQLSAAGEVLTTFADEVMTRNRPDSGRRSESRSSRRENERNSSSLDEEERDSDNSRRGRRTITGLATDLPADISSGFLRAFNRSLDIPSRAVERFQSVYRETEEKAEPTPSPTGKTERSSSRRSESRRSTKASKSRTRRTKTRRSPMSAQREEASDQEAT